MLANWKLLMKCPEHNRTLPNVPRDSGDVITRGPTPPFLEKPKEKNLYHSNQFMDTCIFSFLGPTHIVSLEYDLV
jgi:hypothetical protein